MSEPTSRQALEEALDLWEFDHRPAPNSPAESASSLSHAIEFMPLADAAQAILDAPPLEWCETHNVERLSRHDTCWKANLSDPPCQFGTYVRVKVGP